MCAHRCKQICKSHSGAVSLKDIAVSSLLCSHACCRGQHGNSAPGLPNQFSTLFVSPLLLCQSLGCSTQIRLDSTRLRVQGFVQHIAVCAYWPCSDCLSSCPLQQDPQEIWSVIAS